MPKHIAHASLLLELVVINQFIREAKAIYDIGQTAMRSQGIQAPCSLILISLISLCFSLLFTTPPSAWSGTVMGDLASRMQPGTWTELNTNGFDNGDILINGTPSDYITQYTDSGAWDPISRRFLYVGAPHMNCRWKFILYNDATNTWQVGPDPLPCGGPSHAYDHNTVDPDTGDFYMRPSHYADVSIVYRYSRTSGTWSQLPRVPEEVVRLSGFAGGGLEYFPEMGGLVLVQKSVTGDVAFFNNATNRWSQLAKGLTMGSYNHFIEYNPVHKVVIFGGGTGSSDVYKLDATGRITKMRNAPVALGILQSLISVDPVSGKYLVLSDAGRFYEYDVVQDSWNLLPTLPPFWGTYWVRPGLIDGTIEAPISTYGVVMYVNYNFDKSKVYLYKHSSTSPPDTIPPAPPANLKVN